MMIKKNLKKHIQSRITISLPKNQIECIDRMKDIVPRSRFIAKILADFLAKSPKNKSNGGEIHV